MIDQEIQNLRTEQLDQLKIGVQEKGTSVVLVIGPEGIGKTSLIKALAHHTRWPPTPNIAYLVSKSRRCEAEYREYPAVADQNQPATHGLRVWPNLQRPWQVVSRQ